MENFGFFSTETRHFSGDLRSGNDRCRILGLQENQGKCLVSVEKKSIFFILLFLLRYSSDSNILGCFEKLSNETFEYIYFRMC